ncbi:uncharacterized protein KZ484_018920 [Pholidichthys leucotaenia]
MPVWREESECGRTTSIGSDTGTSPTTSSSFVNNWHDTCKRKTSHSTMDLVTVFAQMQADEVRHHEQHHEQREQQLDQCEWHIHLILNDTRESKEQDAALRRE